jgi:hypothetical protein
MVAMEEEEEEQVYSKPLNRPSWSLVVLVWE